MDATNGNDANPGTSRGQPWQTYANINGSLFRPTDHIRFKRGETFNGTITIPSAGLLGDLITLDAYGTGAAPILDGGANATIQVTAANRGYWHIRNLDIRCTGDVEGGSRGIHHRAGGGWIDNVPGWIIENCAFNCGVSLRGTGIKVLNNVFDGAGNAEAKDMLQFYETFCSNLLVEGNIIRNCSDRGIWLEQTGHNHVIRNNIVHDVVIGYLGVGMGIDVDGFNTPGISGAIVEGNTVYNCFDFGILMENTYGGPIVRDNTVYNCGTLGIGMDITAAGLLTANLNALIYNNLVYECTKSLNLWDVSGCDIWHNTLVDSTAEALIIWPTLGHPEYSVDVSFKNNILTCAAGLLMYFRENNWDLLTDHDYNVYYGVNKFAIDDPYQEMTLAQFQTETGQEANSVYDDPDFINPGADNYHLLVTSPAIGEGVNVGIADDLDGVTRGDPPDIGALEYVA